MEGTSVEATGFLAGIIQEFQQGEPWIFAIAFAFALSIGIALERFFTLRRFSIDGPSFMFEIQKYILANDLDGAIRVCNGARGAALSRVLKSGLQRATRTDEQIQNAIDASSLEVIPKLERRLPYLAVIANIAVLLGLLGTIMGLIQSFAAVEIADAAQRQAILSGGIADAMNATASGLITAIFTMIAHSILSTKATQVLTDIDEFSVKLMDLLSARKFREESK